MRVQIVPVFAVVALTTVATFGADPVKLDPARPAYMRVSGTWANSTYFHDSDDPAPASPPAGFGGVLTRAT